MLEKRPTMDSLEKLLIDLKALHAEKGEGEWFTTRYEDWIEDVRDQVDHIPGEDKPDRVISEQEVVELMELAREMKDSGKEAFAEHDFSMAVTRFMQITNILKDIVGVKENVKQCEQIVRTRQLAYRSLSISALKNWEWNKARHACAAVLKNDPTDYVVMYRQAKAFMQLGRFAAAKVALRTIVQSTLEKTDPVWRCAKRELKRIIDVENKSNNDLRGAMQEGAKKGLFSEDRPKNESAGEEVQSPRAVNFFKEKEAREKEPKKVREIISRERFDIPPSGSPQPEAEDDGLAR